MPKMIEDLQRFPLLLILNSVANGGSSGINAFILTLLTIMSFDDDLHRLRPSSFYPPEVFFVQRACHDDFGTETKRHKLHYHE